MKKIFTLFMVIALVISLGACSKKQINEETTNGEKEIKTEEVAKAQNPIFPKFDLKDIEGNEISSKDFEDYDLTMINIWGTFCPPCIKELPELQKLSDEYKDKKVRIVGIVADRDEYGAKELLAKKSVTYTNFIPNREIEEKVLSNFDAVPTTIFVNSKGEISRKIVVGAKSFEDYKEYIEKILKDF